MLEVKLKAKVLSLEPFYERVQRIARRSHSGEYVEYFFVNQGFRKLCEFKIRSGSRQRKVTLKFPIEKGKLQVNEEHTFSVDNANDFVKILEFFNFQLHLKLTKKFSCWKPNEPSERELGVEIMLVTIPALGNFVEIVAHCKKEELKKARARVIELARSLDLAESLWDSRYYNEMQTGAQNKF
ncbi:hypothetical protein D6817_01110 [Candidatus Pacearchaeota archaeon]|nr:MAG: hypothetical protein D6817_01110 [Candidatus Pacearchaeota archaeon]